MRFVRSLTATLRGVPRQLGRGRSALGAATVLPAAGIIGRRGLLLAVSAIIASPGAPALAKAEADNAWVSVPPGGFTQEYFSGYQKTSSGLEFKVVEEGNGVKPKAGQKIKAHYAGFLSNGKKFDSSYDRKSPLAFEVGVGRVIKGWDEALLDMQVGEKRILRIPSALGYGSRGAGGVIPPDATLIFFVELVTLAA
ncbi:hypothetical protein AB1Y20_007591 [Prymnesium parvum]|uniref:peptidylprolyl isomerase n=1 Tax=Prymnesium parvum TaxID=97485 RepID=A0AB34IWH7_PRYPA